MTLGPAADLQVLLDFRDELMGERTALANRLHADLSGLRPGYQAQIPTLTRCWRDASIELASSVSTVSARAMIDGDTDPLKLAEGRVTF